MVRAFRPQAKDSGSIPGMVVDPKLNSTFLCYYGRAVIS